MSPAAPSPAENIFERIQRLAITDAIAAQVREARRWWQPAKP